MEEPCDLDELSLLEYLVGSAPQALRARVEASPACRAEAQELGRRLAQLYRARCPEAELLVAYQERRIADSGLQLSLHAHVGGCPMCAEELAVLAAIDIVPLGHPPAPLRRVVMAVLQGPLRRPVAVRGPMLVYQTPQLAVHLRVRQGLDRQGAWTVRGQVRGADGRLAADLLQAVRARAADGHTLEADVEDQGAFRFQALPAGDWTLELQTANETIVIEHLAVGDSPASETP